MILLLQILAMVVTAVLIPVAFVGGSLLALAFDRVWPFLAGLALALILFALLVWLPFVFWIPFGS